MHGIEPGGASVSPFQGNQVAVDVDRAQPEVGAAALASPELVSVLSTMVLECTDLPSHTQAIRYPMGLERRGLADPPAAALYPGDGGWA